MGPEAKWQKASRSRFGFYTDAIALFAKNSNLRFRCVSIDREKVDLIRFHEADAELGFYKFYYQLLHHWILDFNDYSAFCDVKANRSKTRLRDLQRCLNRTNLSSRVRVQAIRSDESVLIQLTDILTGAAAARLNGSVRPGSVRSDLVVELEQALGHGIAPTARGEQKFNVFRMDFAGGW